LNVEQRKLRTVEPSRVLLGSQQSIVVDGVRMLLLLLLVVSDEWRPEDDRVGVAEIADCS